MSLVDDLLGDGARSVSPFAKERLGSACTCPRGPLPEALRPAERRWLRARRKVERRARRRQQAAARARG